MAAAAGGVILVLALLGWGGQSIAALAPAVATGLGLLSQKTTSNPPFGPMLGPKHCGMR